jgi:hypothetical protein
MALRDRLRRLEKTMQGKLAHFELEDGQRFYFDPQEAFNSMGAVWKREPRPEPPALLKAVADAKDRVEALEIVMGGSSFLALDREALVERGAFVPRSLVAGREYGDLGVSEDLSE